MKPDCSYVPRLFPSVPMSVPRLSVPSICVVLAFDVFSRLLSSLYILYNTFIYIYREHRNNIETTLFLVAFLGRYRLGGNHD